MITVSIICPIYNEERFIDNCIQSVLHQDIPSDRWELLLVDGFSTDTTRQHIQPYIEQYTNIRLLDNPHHTVPYAMNIGIHAAQGQYICRMDVHASFPSNYVSTLLRYINELPDAANVGCTCNTMPVNDSAKAHAIAIACSHPLGVGNSTFRTATVRSPKRVGTVPFGFWSKNLFDQVGLFDEELTRNQDDEFNARTIQSGKHIYLVPNTCITYYTRDKIRKIRRMFYQYGLFKPLVNHKLKHPATIRQFVPLLFIIELIIGFPLSFVHPVLCGIYITTILSYVLCIGIAGIHYRNAYLPLVFATMHFSYGWGYICGIGKVLFREPINAKTNR